MTKLEQIEKAVAQLDRQELEAFSLWFEELQVERWDRQIEKDDAEGKFDRLAEDALTEFRAGKTRSL
ncbi:hypothetical protein [Neorhizobium galegae]|uniref:hypothetical protein n=1 Tax=Neorhizobium galegae TaxID=399 RepID=UPI000621DD05|nr:hypothetical protein [Neorhizobium galegae]CDZ25227.1 Hypothetical protein NGAL_HAMBI490_00590 [Neorhizobium galegae bv. officinalis]KAA9387899.1 hypothetical protein F4V88_16265 [Neorhizobium galegae]KAB1115630.1 hypothetical protein F4V89_04200 [Neorhizobium galegae]MCM2498168.1 hypothetical protein [Neorhizobium galegae]MCQ1774137.1 hypothetical protein [Neorhizobium galegae]